MRRVRVTAASAAAIFAVLSVSAFAQEPPTPAPAADQLPPVDVIQKQPAPAPKAAKKSAAKKKQVSPPPQPPAAVAVAPAGPQRDASGRVVDGAPNLSPINASSGILPADLQHYVGAGTKVTTQQIDEQRPKDNHEILSHVPGVMVVNDDGMSRHSGIGIRGAPFRRSRKVLVLEDGQAINFSTILDPSTHYTPPTDRVEGVEVLRGYNIPFGPLTNHGIVNFQNLNPFGAEETVISASIGTTEGVNKEVNNTRHIHTRQHAGNVGVVGSYSGAESGGAWDNEVLRYNDFYGALGWKGTDQDLTVSGVYFRQRDNYDENNFIGDEADFYANRRGKSSSPFFVGSSNLSDLNTYNADYYRLQFAHNLYIDDDTTLSTRAYYSHNERNRFAGRRWGDDVGVAGNGYMRGRERTYEVYGADSRIEFANLPLFAGMTQDVQAGVRYEWHDFRNCNSVGLKHQVLDDDTSGNCFVTNAVGAGAFAGTAPLTPGVYRENSRYTETDGDIFSAFVQTAIHVTRDLTVTPGVRFDDIEITQNNILNPEAPAQLGTFESNHSYVLPGVAFAWEAIPRSTLYGSFHQGITPQVTRGPAFPLPEEKGDNYQIGVRSTAVQGLTFDLAYFYSEIENYQIKSPTTDIFQNSVYGTVDEVEINGFEFYSRLDSQPFTGGKFNFFGEAVYTYADSEITKSDIPAEIGKAVPEVPRNFASLTAGVEEKGIWDASLTWTYRGSFFTDSVNTGAWACIDEDSNPIDCNDDDAEGVVGKVSDVWLLSARANYTIPGTDTTLFVAGQNLTNEFYVSDFSDGAKPGIGRTLWAGFKMKLQ